MSYITLILVSVLSSIISNFVIELLDDIKQNFDKKPDHDDSTN